MPRGRWFEEPDDDYMSMRYPGLYGLDDFYSEVSPYDLDQRGFRRPTIGPVKRGPKDARIGPATPQPPPRRQPSWLDRMTSFASQGYPMDDLVFRQKPGEPAPKPQNLPFVQKPGDKPPQIVPLSQRPARIGPTAGLGSRLPAGNYPDENVPQVRQSRIGPARFGPQDSQGMLTSRSSPVAPNQTAAMYGGRNPFATAMANARANSTGTAGTPMPPSPYGEGMERIPNAMRIAMENARANSNRPGAHRQYGTPEFSGNPAVNAMIAARAGGAGGPQRPGVFQAQGVTDPTSVNVNGRYDIGFNPRAYPAATRVAAAARPPRLAPRGIPSGVPEGPPPGGLTAPPMSPIQSVGGTNGSPYESPIGESGWTRNMPGSFVGQAGPAGPGAFNRFDITQQGGRNSGAEGNLPADTVPSQSGSPSAQQNPYLEGGAQYNWDPIRRYNEYLDKEPGRGDYQPRGWGRILNAATAGLHGYQTGDVSQAVALGRNLNEQPYERAVEDWKRKGSGLARAAELEDKRYNIAVQNENRRADNFRQQQELDLRRQTHMLNDEKFRHELTMDEWKMLQEGWKTQAGPDGTMIMFRPGANGQMEYRNTRVPNNEYTAAEKRAEAKTLEEGRNRRSQTSAAATLGAAKIGAESRAAEGKATRAHQATEGLFRRDVQREIAGMRGGATGGEDYTSPARLLGSPNFRDLSKSGLVKIYQDPNTNAYTVDYDFENDDEMMKELEKRSGGDPAKFRRMADSLTEFRNYMTRYGG